MGRAGIAENFKYNFLKGRGFRVVKGGKNLTRLYDSYMSRGFERGVLDDLCKTTKGCNVIKERFDLNTGYGIGKGKRMDKKVTDDYNIQVLENIGNCFGSRRERIQCVADLIMVNKVSKLAKQMVQEKLKSVYSKKKLDRLLSKYDLFEQKSVAGRVNKSFRNADVAERYEKSRKAYIKRNSINNK